MPQPASVRQLLEQRGLHGTIEQQMIYAIKHGNTARAIELIDGNNLNVNAVSVGTRKPIIVYACEKGRETIVRALLSATPPANINATTPDGKTALMLACENDHSGVVRVLLEANPPADINLMDNSGQTALTLLQTSVIPRNYRLESLLQATEIVRLNAIIAQLTATAAIAAAAPVTAVATRTGGYRNNRFTRRRSKANGCL